MVEAEDDELVLPPGVEFAPTTSMLDLFNWYKRNLCQAALEDCRGYRVTFREEDFVHLIKLVDRYGEEPRNREAAISNIKSGQIRFFFGGRHSPPNFSIERAKQLSLVRSIIRDPWRIVENWQPMGRANPGEAYIRNFGSGRARYRVLICGIAGRKRIPVTLFPRQRFSAGELHLGLWP